MEYTNPQTLNELPSTRWQKPTPPAATVGSDRIYQLAALTAGIFLLATLL